MNRLPQNVRRVKGEMEASTDAAIAQMSWLKPSDFAMVTLALQYARQLDSAVDDARAVGYLGQQLHAVMKSLGGTPVERKLLDSDGGSKSVVSGLREARAARQRNSQALDPSSS